MDSNTTFISKAGLQRFYARIYEVFANKIHTHVGTDVDAATTTVRGTVQPDGTTVEVNAAGLISIPTATSSKKGLVQPDGTTVEISSGTISIPTATSNKKGLVQPDGSTIEVSNGTISIPDAATNKKGLLSGSDKTKLDGIATGATKVEKTNDTTLTITDSVNQSTTFSGMTSAERAKLNGISESANNYSLPTASSNTLGGVKVGTNLTITEGVLDIANTVALVSALSSYLTIQDFNTYKNTRETNFGEDIGDGLAVSPSKKLMIDVNYLGEYISEYFESTVGEDPVYNSKVGRYYNYTSGSNLGISEWLATDDQHIYTTRIPKWTTSHDVYCTKTNDNAGLSVIPSTEASANTDDYKELPAFKIWEVNGGYDSNGIPYVTAFKGRDSWFSRTGENGDVWIMTRVLWYKWEEDTDYQYLSISLYPHTGFIPEPGAVLSDGTSLRPYILRAKYPLSINPVDNKIASISGVPPRNRDISYNTLITRTATKGVGYGSLSVDDLWYLKTMLLIKYAVKSSQAAFAGCSSFNITAYPVVAETDVKRVILSSTDAAKFPVGSTISISTSDRGGQVADMVKVVSKEEVDGNVALNLNLASNISTLTTHMVQSMPWYCGSCDEVLGTDGSPSDVSSGIEPFILQGIEYMVGLYEISTDIMFNWTSDETNGHVGHILVGQNRATKVSGNSTGFVDTGLTVGQGTSTNWVYPTDFTHLNGLIITTNTGASQTTGVGDGNYTYGTSTTETGLREFRAFGSLGYSGLAGASCFTSYNVLSYAYWDYGGRLTGTDTYGTWTSE